MVDSLLREFLDGRRAQLLWIEYAEYAHHVFAGDAADWFIQSSRYANTILQAQKAIRSDVLTFDLAASGLALSALDDPPVARARQILTSPTGLRFAAECLDALGHRLGDSIDIVLRVPTPLDLLNRCSFSDDADFDLLDDLSALVTATLREFSGRRIAGVLLQRDSPLALSADEEDAYAPILNAASHYGWARGFAVTAAFAQHAQVPADADFLLCGELTQSEMEARRGLGHHLGGGLTDRVWQGETPAPAFQQGGLLYGQVPPSANPETVLAVCAALAGS